MDKRAQPYTPEEAKKWILESGERWDPKTSLEAARKFYQVWNKKKGRGASRTLLPNEPLKCTIWRDRAMDYERLIQDLIHEALPSYAAALNEVYDELKEIAKTDSSVARKLRIVDKILYGDIVGVKRYPLADWLDVEHKYEEEKLFYEPKQKKMQPAAKIIPKYYFEILESVPGLQQKFIELIAKDLYTNYKAGAGGYWAGQTTTGEPRRLLTFYLMEDPYPYFRTNPVRPDGTPYTKETKPEVCADWGGKTSVENPAPIGKATSKKVTIPYTTYTFPTCEVIVKNDENPSYDFAKLSHEEIDDPKLQKERVADIVDRTRQASLFDPGFHIGKNVFQNPETHYENRGIKLTHLPYVNIHPSDRDLTKLPEGGLFRVPPQGLPAEKPTFKKTMPSGKFRLPPEQATLSHGLLEVFGQEGELEEGGIWIDDQGRAYDTVDELLATYEAEREELLDQQLPEMLKGAIIEDLEGEALPEVADETSVYEVEEEEPVEDKIQQMDVEDWEVQEEEQTLPLAAKKIERLVQVANELDNKGLTKQANIVDGIIKDLFEQMTRHDS